MHDQPAGNLSSHGLRPIHDQVLVRQDPVPETLPSGLYLTGSAMRELQEDLATVLAIGPKVLDVAVGDRVLIKRRADTALVPDKREGGRPDWIDLLMLRETDIVGIVE